MSVSLLIYLFLFFHFVALWATPVHCPIVQRINISVLPKRTPNGVREAHVSQIKILIYLILKILQILLLVPQNV